MKRLIAIILAVICSLSFASCSSDKSKDEAEKISSEKVAGELVDSEVSSMLKMQTVCGYDYAYNNEYDVMMAELSYEYVVLDENTASIYPELDAALNSVNEERIEGMETSYEEMCNSTQDVIDEFGAEGSLPTNYLKEESYVRRADDKATVILYFSESYYGGAHSVYSFFADNYDTKSGELLNIDDVVSDKELLIDLVEKKINTDHKDEIFPETDIRGHIGDCSNLEWILDYNGLTVIFNPYEIASFDSGSIFVNLPFEEYPELVKEEYTKVPSSYAVYLPSFTPFFYDIDADGETDVIEAGNNFASYEYEVYSFEMLVNGENSIENPVTYFENKIVFIHMEDGKNYIYNETTMEGDYQETQIYGFDKTEPEEIDVISMGGLRLYGEDTYGEVLITDPTDMTLSFVTYILSTVHTADSYAVNGLGIPEKDTDWYTVCENDQYEFTLKTDLEVKVVDTKTGKTTGDIITLSEGDKVKYDRTDGKSYGDVLTSDDTLVRVSLDTGENVPMSVDGVDIDDIFEGLLFAN